MSLLRTYLAVVALGSVMFAQESGSLPPPSAHTATQVSGDQIRGQAIFEGKGGCLSCHRVANQGSRMGPDLSSIGEEHSTRDLQKALLDPSPDVAPRNRLYRVETRDGREIIGRLLNQDVYSLQMLDSQEQLVAFQRSNLRAFGFAPTPPMPSYRNKLNSQEQTDLIAYLTTLRGVTKQ